MQDSDINVYVTATNGGTVSGQYGSANGAVAGNSASGFQIASGTIPADGSQHQHDFTLTMWVNESVTISDTDTGADYCASEEACQGDRTVYSDLYYSLKVNVSATDQ